MECEIACRQIGAWIDRELSPEEAAPLEAHLAICPECRSAAELLRSQDAELSRAFEPARAAAEHVAAAVIARLNDERRADETPPTIAKATVAKPLVAEPPVMKPAVTEVTIADGLRPRRDYAALTFAAAAGFLLAILLFPPWKRSTTAPAPIVTAPPPTARPAVAQLVVATGDVQMRTAGAAEFDTHVYLEHLICPSDAVVRTGPNVRCEWKTTDGCVVRLNGDTQVRFASDGVVEVQRGQIACSSPENASLKVIVPEHRTSTTGISTTEVWTMGPSATGRSPIKVMCQAQSSAIAAVEPDGNVQVTSSAGDVALQTPAGASPLKQGESVRLIEGRIVPVRATDPLLAAGWTGALLMRKGHENPELARRVDELLARMGQSKVSLLYEEEIRALGEYAVLPLLKYVESPLSQNERVRRQAAMRLAADLAPTWAVTDLIRLLADADAETRFLAAQALLRLTGNHQGRPPEKWREDLKNCAPTIELWRTWLREEPNRFPPRKPDRQT